MDNSPFQEPHLIDSIKVILRRKRVILLTLIITFLLVMSHSLSLFPLYFSSSTIQLESEKWTSISFSQQNYPDYGWLDDKWFNTQVKILNSRSLAHGVVKRLGLRLQTKPEERTYQILLDRWIPGGKKYHNRSSGIKVKSITVGGNATNGRYVGTFLDDKSYILFDPDGQEIGKGEVDQPFTGPNLSCLVKGAGGKGKRFEFVILPESQAARNVMSRLVVSMVPSSNLINVGVKWEDSEWAREIANAVVEEYKLTLINKRTRETSRVLSFIESQLNETEKDLSLSEQKLKNFKEQGKIVSLDGKVTRVLEQITASEKEYRTLESYRRQAEILLSALKAPGDFSDKKALYSLGIGLNNEYLNDLTKKLGDLTAQKSPLSIQMKEEHPKIQALNREIESVKNSLTNAVSAQISALKVKEESCLASLRKFESEVKKLPAVEQELFSLERVAKVGQGINLFLLQKRAEMSINKESVLGNVQVIDPAIRPRKWAEPDLLRRVLWALLIGTTLSLSLAFLIEYFDTTLKTPEQVQRMTELPYLGTIYQSANELETPGQDLKLLNAPFSQIAEAFRTVKTNLLFHSNLEKGGKLFLITSSGPSEGKTFVTANLATALAQSGKAVLVVETDLRNPTLHKLFGAKRSPGLSSALANGSMDFQSLPIQNTGVENLEIIAAGEKPPNPSELLCSTRMDEFTFAARERYDYVLFDSPPAYLTSDPLVLAQKVDGIVFVARSGEVKKEIFQETLESFAKLNPKMLGVLFNGMLRSEGRFYYYKYSSYYHDGDGGRKKKRVRMRSSRSRNIYAGYGEKDKRVTGLEIRSGNGSNETTDPAKIKD